MRTLVLMAILLTTAATANPKGSAPTPYGEVTLAKPWAPTDAQAEMLRGWAGEHFGRAFRVAAERQATHSWFVFGAAWDSGGVWKKGETIALTLKGGHSLEAAIVMAMTPIPVCDPVVLGLADRFLNPSELEHMRSVRGIAILAGFPEPLLSLGDITGVQVRKRSPTAAPAPASGGSR